MRPLTQPDALYTGRVHHSYFHEGQFLSIAETVEALEPWQFSGIPGMVAKYNHGQSRFGAMLQIYGDLPSKQFPVAQLRHVTTADGFMGIMQDGEVHRSDRIFLLNGVETLLPVSCWGVHIPPKRLQVYRKKRFAQFMQLATERGLTCILSPEETAEVRDMLANSPAMREDSRYGNFQFSFSTKDLLAMYRDQHCGGQKPMLRVLGTEAYKQELVHWILIHSPVCEQFNHLPTVDPPGPFSRDGNLTWAPESMTNKFVYAIFNSNLTKKPMAYSNDQLIQTYDPWIWNNAVFAFHLPQNRALRIDRRRLLENVQACETTQGLFGVNGNKFLRHPREFYITKEQAESTIETMKIQRGM